MSISSSNSTAYNIFSNLGRIKEKYSENIIKDT